MIRHFIQILIFLITLASGSCSIDIDSTNINHGAVIDSINNLQNAVNKLKIFKTDNIFAKNNIFDKYYLARKDVEDDFDSYMQHRKLSQQILSKSHKTAAPKKILRDGSDSEEENDGSNNKEDNRENKNKDNLRFFDCEYGKSQCVKACKEAYRETCDIEECERSLRRRLRKYCKRFCTLWFY